MYLRLTDIGYQRRTDVAIFQSTLNILYKIKASVYVFIPISFMFDFKS